MYRTRREEAKVSDNALSRPVSETLRDWRKLGSKLFSISNNIKI